MSANGPKIEDRLDQLEKKVEKLGERVISVLSAFGRLFGSVVLYLGLPLLLVGGLLVTILFVGLKACT